MRGSPQKMSSICLRYWFSCDRLASINSPDAEIVLVRTRLMTSADTEMSNLLRVFVTFWLSSMNNHGLRSILEPKLEFGWELKLDGDQIRTEH